MQTLTHTLKELKNNTEPHGVCPPPPHETRKDTWLSGAGVRGSRSLCLGTRQQVAQVEGGQGPFSPEEKCTDGVEAPRQGAPISQRIGNGQAGQLSFTVAVP